MSVVKKAFNAVGLAPDVPKIETNVPAVQPTRESETQPDDVSIGVDDTGRTRGKRALVRPVASSVGGV